MCSDFREPPPPADFSRHVVLTGERLAACRRASGLEDVVCRPFLSANFCIVPTAHLRPGAAPHESLAPYLVCVGRHPPGAA